MEAMCSVELTMSANSTVACFSSPVRLTAEGPLPSPGARGAPQAPQNRANVDPGLPHEGQMTASSAPQFVQKRLP